MPPRWPICAVLLDHESPRVQNAALWLLDQPPHERLAADDVLKRIGSASDDLRRTALALLTKHPEWAGDSIALIRKRIMASELSPAEAQALDSLLTAFERNSEIQSLVADAVRGRRANVRREQVLAWMATSRMAKLPDNWIDALKAAVGDPNPNIVRQAVQTIGVLRLVQFDTELLAIARNEKLPAEIRIDALRASLPRNATLDDSCFRLLADELAGEATGVRRLAAAELLGKATLSEPQALRLLEKAGDDSLIWPSLLPACARLSTATSAWRSSPASIGCSRKTPCRCRSHNCTRWWRSFPTTSSNAPNRCSFASAGSPIRSIPKSSDIKH